MSSFFSLLGGGHGHTHGAGGTCPGHQGGGHQGGGHSHMEMSEEMRAQLMQQLEAQMMMMKNGPNSLIRQGKVLYDPNDPGPGEYNKLVYGYGHDGGPLPVGWGSLSPSILPEHLPPGDPTMSIEDSFLMHNGPGERDRFWLINLPVVGRLRVVKDRPGIMQALGVVLYWLYGNWSIWMAVLLPYYADGAISLPLILADWTECKSCNMLRPPKSHHCRRCGHCVRRMDHHCPWINNCVGEENQFAFMLLLLYAFLLSVVTIIIQFIYFFQLEACISCDKNSFTIRYQNTFMYVCLIMAVLMLSFSLGLLSQLHFGVMIDMPTVERMKVERDMYTTGAIPEQLLEQSKPVRQLYNDMCGNVPFYCILLPCRRRRSACT